MKILPSVCIAGFGLLGVSCGPSARERSGAVQIGALQEDVRALQEQVAKSDAASREAREALREFQDETTKKQRQVISDKEAAQKKLEEVQKAFDAYRAKYRVTARASSQKFALISACGTSYKDVEVMEVTPGELRFHHSYGLAKVPLGMLDPKLREHFDYDADEAEAWLASNTKTAVQVVDEEEEKEGRALAQFRARGGFNSLASAGKLDPDMAANLKKRYQRDLNELYVRARQLQADQNCCQIHKKHTLAGWAKEADDLKKRIASLPSS